MRKVDRTPEEAHMSLHRRPSRPHYIAFLLLSEAGPKDVWQKYVYR